MGEKRTKCPTRKVVRIVVVSDTHELHRELEMPAADIFCCCGDWTMMSRSMRAVADFNEWLAELPYRHRILVPGNHETYLANDPSLRRLTSNGTVLINQGIEIDGLRIWGSPVTPHSQGAFCIPSAERREQVYATIPMDINILITHGPPIGILDSRPNSAFRGGDPELLQAVTRIRPKLHLFGHVHAGRGMTTVGETTFINASMLTDFGDLDQQPILISMAKK